MNLDDILYVEVNLERPLVSDAFAASTDFAVVLEHCWGTPYNDRSGEMKYFIIKNQCLVGRHRQSLTVGIVSSDLRFLLLLISA